MMTHDRPPGAGRIPSLPKLNLPLVARGKVRDIYRLDPDDGGGRLLIAASDRISAFDVIMPTPVPDKGRLLTEIAAWWLRFVEDRRLAETHLLSTDVGEVPADAFSGEATRQDYEGRVMIVRECRVTPIECVVRGYLEGSGWREYQQTGAVCGISLPAGLRQCDRLPEPIFTPATKATDGHDQNITFEQAAEAAGLETMGALREISLAIYRAASEHAESRGLILADTKFEFGLPIDAVSKEGRVWQQPMLVDEALTPDSSRYWAKADYQPGRAQRSFDKQFLREHLEELVANGLWDKTPPGPNLPDRIVCGVRERYVAARDMLCR